MEENKNAEERLEVGEPFKQEEVKATVLPQLSIAQPGTENPKQEIKTMEVHHHPQVEKKGFKEYLFEFIMIFLAVTLGFFAEQVREHIVENNQEKEYINSMLEDLKTDIANVNHLVSRFKEKTKLLDSVIAGFDAATHTYNYTWAQQFLKSYRGGFPDFYPTDRTMQQLKNSGGLRLIKNKKAAEGIIKYDAQVKDVQEEESILSAMQANYNEEILKVWSIDKMYKDAGVTSWANNKSMIVKNNYWITNDSIAFEHLFNQLSEYNEITIGHIRDYISLKEKAIALIALLQKEY